MGLAVDTGQPAAAALRASALPVALTVLGRFELTVAGRSVELRPGQEAQLLKLVAVSAGQLHAEQAIETLWPEGGRAEGRNRLRTVLNRLRSAAGNVLVRQGDLLVLIRSVSVDFEGMLAEPAVLDTCHRGPALAATIARGAIVRYRENCSPKTGTKIGPKGRGSVLAGPCSTCSTCAPAKPLAAATWTGYGGWSSGRSSSALTTTCGTSTRRLRCSSKAAGGRRFQ